MENRFCCPPGTAHVLTGGQGEGQAQNTLGLEELSSALVTPRNGARPWSVSPVAGGKPHWSCPQPRLV